MSGPVGYAGSGACFSSASSREYGLLMPSPSHLHCVAAILWHSYELPVDYDLHVLLNRELFESVVVFYCDKSINTYIVYIIQCEFAPLLLLFLLGWVRVMNIRPFKKFSESAMKKSF